MHQYVKIICSNSSRYETHVFNYFKNRSEINNMKCTTNIAHYSQSQSHFQHFIQYLRHITHSISQT